MSTNYFIKIRSTGERELIARQVGIGDGKVMIFFTNPLAELLFDELVVTNNNSDEKVKTVGDLKRAINETRI